MSFIPEAYAECSLEITIPGDAGPAFVIFGVKDNLFGPGPDGVLTAVGDAVNNVPGVTNLLGTDATITRLTVRYGLTGGGIAIRESAPNLTGNNAGPFLPPQVALLCAKESGLAGRQNRGRSYWPCVPESAVENSGLLTSGALSGLSVDAAAFHSDLATLDVPMVILHDNPAITPTLVDSYVLRAKVATQRRRLR